MDEQGASHTDGGLYGGALSVWRVCSLLIDLKDAQEGRNRGPHVHYSKCQLYIGDFAFPPTSESADPVTRRCVFSLLSSTFTLS